MEHNPLIAGLINGLIRYLAIMIEGLSNLCGSLGNGT
jgi:hypothetical protein